VVSGGAADRRIDGSICAARGTLHAARLLVLALLVGAGTLTAQDQIGLALGATPVAVTIEDLDGNTADLGQWIGKTPVVLQFWATWCPVCEELSPKVAAARAKHGDAVAFIVVAVGVNQSPRRVRRYLEQHPDMGVVVWDGKGAAVRAFEAPGTSYVVALDASGKVVYTGFGADQDIAGAFAAAIR
jgi:thiol-disulfide isomerase/thioredoxin